MATLGSRGHIVGKITLVLDEEEAAALEALAGYGTKPFLKVFYEKMGRAYLEPHERGLVSLFEAIYGGDASVGGFLNRFKDARAVMDGRKCAIYPPQRSINQFTGFDDIEINS
jgi:hypothetical protein